MERHFFAGNPNVGGMAADDNQIVLNPYSKLKDTEKQSVALNEAYRLKMRQQNIIPEFALTPEQETTFRGTPYEQNPLEARRSLVARMLTGDPSAGRVTPEQQFWMNKVR